MSGQRLNKSERNFVSKGRKAFIAEQRIRTELFSTVIAFDKDFAKLFSKPTNSTNSTHSTHSTKS